MNTKIIKNYLFYVTFIVFILNFTFTGHTAEASPINSFTINSQTVSYGDVITVPVVVTMTDIEALQFSINYPESELQYLGCTSVNVVCSHDIDFTNVASTTDRINLTWLYDAVNLMTLNNEPLLSLQFKVISSNESQAVLSFEPVEILDRNDVDIKEDFIFNSGVISLNHK